MNTPESHMMNEPRLLTSVLCWRSPGRDVEGFGGSGVQWRSGHLLYSGLAQGTGIRRHRLPGNSYVTTQTSYLHKSQIISFRETVMTAKKCLVSSPKV